MASDDENSTTFESKIREIDFEIQKRKSRWRLTSLSWMDFDDISQILRIHIYKKWHLYDPSKPLAPWLNRIISNQIKNLVRFFFELWPDKLSTIIIFLKFLLNKNSKTL